MPQTPLSCVIGEQEFNRASNLSTIFQINNIMNESGPHRFINLFTSELVKYQLFCQGRGSLILMLSNEVLPFYYGRFSHSLTGLHEKGIPVLIKADQKGCFLGHAYG